MICQKGKKNKGCAVYSTEKRGYYAYRTARSWKSFKENSENCSRSSYLFQAGGDRFIKRKISGLVGAEKEDPQKTPLFRGRSVERIGQAIFDLVYEAVYSDFKTQTDRNKNRVDIQKQLTIAGDMPLLFCRTSSVVEKFRRTYSRRSLRILWM